MVIASIVSQAYAWQKLHFTALPHWDFHYLDAFYYHAVFMVDCKIAAYPGTVTLFSAEGRFFLPYSPIPMPEYISLWGFGESLYEMPLKVE